MISAAKESGDIEYTADVILAIGEQQDDGAPVTLSDPGLFAWNIMIAKNRQGMSSSTGARVELVWRPMFQQFIERESTPDDADPQESNGRYTRRRGTGGSGQ